jgi:hypothetical protein
MSIKHQIASIKAGKEMSTYHFLKNHNSSNKILIYHTRLIQLKFAIPFIYNVFTSILTDRGVHHSDIKEYYHQNL